MTYDAKILKKFKTYIRCIRRYLFLTNEVKRLNLNDVKQSLELSRKSFASNIYNSSFSVMLCIFLFLLPGCECFAFCFISCVANSLPCWLTLDFDRLILTTSGIFTSYLLYMKSSHFNCSLHTDDYDVIQQTIITIVILRLTELVLISYRDHRNICEGGCKTLNKHALRSTVCKEKYWQNNTPSSTSTRPTRNLNSRELIISKTFNGQVPHLNTKYSNGHNNLLLTKTHFAKINTLPPPAKLVKAFYQRKTWAGAKLHNCRACVCHSNVEIRLASSSGRPQ